MAKGTKFFVGIMLILIIPDVVSGQTEGRKVFIGGGSQLSLTRLNTNWESNQNAPQKTTTLDFSPHFGFFISNSFVLGAIISLNRVTERVDTNKEKTTSVALGPFLRYYIENEGNVRPYFQGMLGPGHMNFTKSWEEEIISYRMFLYEIDFGLAFFVHENVSFDLILGYASTKYDQKSSDEPDKSEIFFTKGLGVKFGLAVLL